jgi:HEAT repeat protein
MIALMGDPEFEVYRIVPDEVAKLGESAVAALIAGLNSGNHMIRRGSAQSLANLNDRRSVEPLITALRDNDSVVREWVCKALGNLKDPRAVEPLITYLKDKSVYESEKRQGIYALGEIADPRAAEVLVDFVNYQSRGGEVARALARIGDPAIPYLLQDKKKLPAIMPILAKIGTPASLGQLVKMITEGDRTVSEMAAHTLAEGIVDPEATEALIPLLKNENPIVRRSAVRALLGIKDPRAVEPLLAAMKDSDPFVRYQAVYTLGFLDDRRAIEPIVEVLRSSDPNLQHVAAESLERITGKDYGVNYSQWKEWLEENRQM